MISSLIILLLFCNISNLKTIKSGVYNIISNNLYLFYNKRKLSLSKDYKHPNTLFRITKVKKINNETFYNIEEIYTKYKLIKSGENEIFFSKKTDDLLIWSLIKLNENDIIIKNKKDNCYILIIDCKIICENISFSKITKFNLIKIYSEVDDTKIYKYYELLNKEPIDVLIKYIDLKDPNLNRTGIHQIEKDYDNEELRYSIRSIINNIPWVRKIFILMPNEKVRYFKDYNYIKDKIIYVKDKDLLGYDSSNSLAFQYRFWKMKKFGISDNIIVMDDDYFIGDKLNKSNFFYVENGKVIPSIVTSNFLKIQRKTVEKNCEFYKNKAEMSKEEQNNDIFNYSKYLTFLFILNIFNISYTQSIFLPKFTHNAIPINLKDLKEVYDLIDKSQFKNSTLNSLYRKIDNLQFQTLILSYSFIKYKRKVNNIRSKFFFLNDSISSNYKFSLLCINKGPGYYSYINLYKEKIAMEYLFPNPSPYELIDYSLINISFNVVNYMDNTLNDYEKKISKMITKDEFYRLEIIINIFLVLVFIKFNYINLIYQYNFC